MGPSQTRNACTNVLSTKLVAYGRASHQFLPAGFWSGSLVSFDVSYGLCFTLLYAVDRSFGVATTRMMAPSPAGVPLDCLFFPL